MCQFYQDFSEVSGILKFSEVSGILKCYCIQSYLKLKTGRKHNHIIPSNTKSLVDCLFNNNQISIRVYKQRYQDTVKSENSVVRKQGCQKTGERENLLSTESSSRDKYGEKNAASQKQKDLLDHAFYRQN